MRLIDKDELLDLFHMYCNFYENAEDAYDRALNEVSIIKEIPTVHAYWFDKGSLSYRCSNCGCKNKKSNYCPKCFVIMNEVD